MKTKKFDCVEMKRKGARKVYEATKGMTVEEEVEYWRKRTRSSTPNCFLLRTRI